MARDDERDRDNREDRDDSRTREKGAPAPARHGRLDRCGDDGDVVALDRIRRGEIDDGGVAFVVRPHDVPRASPARVHHGPTSNGVPHRTGMSTPSQ